MIIGTFELVDGSYIGMIDTLNGSIATTIHPQERGPDYLVSSAESKGEFGAAWKRTSRERKPCCACQNVGKRRRGSAGEGAHRGAQRLGPFG